MDISVILPVYNSEAYLSNAVESVLGQDFKGSFELIIVDDCSTDGTASIIAGYAGNARVTALRTPENGGYPTAMNLGLSVARGKYVSRMDADDVWHHSLLAVEHKMHEQKPDVAFVSSRRFWLTVSGKPYHKPFKSGEDYVFETWHDLMNRNRSFTDVGTLFLKERSDRIGGYNTYQRSGMDVDHWLRIMELTGSPCLTLSIPLVGKRLVPESIIFQAQTTKTNEIARELAIHRRENGLPPDHRPDEEWLKQSRSKNRQVSTDGRRVSFIVDVAMTNLRMGDVGGFLGFFGKAFKRNPFGAIKAFASRALRGRWGDHKPGLPEADGERPK